MTARLPRPLIAEVSCEGLSRQVLGWPSRVSSREEALEVWAGPSAPRTQARWASKASRVGHCPPHLPPAHYLQIVSEALGFPQPCFPLDSVLGQVASPQRRHR